MRNMNDISILDSTLRDGAQGVGISFSVEDKLQIVQLLAKLGIHYIEAGNPFSNPKDLEFFKRLKPIENSKITAFGSTRRKNIAAQEDKNLQSLLDAGTQVCSIFGKSWGFHVKEVLETTLQENLLMIEDSCRFLKSRQREVIYDAEHFFDGYMDNNHYAMETLYAAVRGGADIVCLCDTNGGTLPGDTAKIVGEVTARLDKPVGLHFHNDSGMATANSILGVNQGAVHVQGTFLGFGERCGNASLIEVIAGLQLKCSCRCLNDSSLAGLTQTARGIAAVANVRIPGNMPYVGKNAFAHKAGMHAAGVIKNAASFEHISPDLVGNKRRLPASEISGKKVVLEHVKQIMPNCSITPMQIEEIVNRVKMLEMGGYQFEGAEASFELLVRKSLGEAGNFFRLKYYRIYTNYSPSGEEIGASAVVKVKVKDEVQLMAAEGNGPVNALDKALRKALELFYPVLSKVKLIDYKVRVLESKSATASPVRVLMTSSVGEQSFTTVGVSEDVVAASWKALEDSIEYLLINYN